MVVSHPDEWAPEVYGTEPVVSPDMPGSEFYKTFYTLDKGPGSDLGTLDGQQAGHYYGYLTILGVGPDGYPV